MVDELKIKRLLYKVEHECGCGTAYELQELFDDLIMQVEDLESRTNDYDDAIQSVSYLNSQLFELQDFINKNDDGTEYYRGMQEAYDMIDP